MATHVLKSSNRLGQISTIKIANSYLEATIEDKDSNTTLVFFIKFKESKRLELSGKPDEDGDYVLKIGHNAGLVIENIKFFCTDLSMLKAVKQELEGCINRALFADN